MPIITSPMVLSAEDALSIWPEDVLPFIQLIKDPEGSLAFLLTRAVEPKRQCHSCSGVSFSSWNMDLVFRG
jgi:hypothetical protein